MNINKDVNLTYVFREPILRVEESNRRKKKWWWWFFNDALVAYNGFIKRNGDYKNHDQFESRGKNKQVLKLHKERSFEKRLQIRSQT